MNPEEDTFGTVRSNRGYICIKLTSVDTYLTRFEGYQLDWMRHHRKITQEPGRKIAEFKAWPYVHVFY